jgi:F1F0 ATPase subunit 2
MNKALDLVFASLAGGMLGAIFFGGLWWTVRQGISSAQPALWFLSSLLVRMSAVLAGFYFVGRGNWERLVACLVGFVVARWIVTYLTRFSPPLEGNHAP